VGTGIYDITGPAVEVNFMGYAVPAQRGTGIHLRLRARAFAFEDDDTATGKRFCFVSVDGGMGSDLVNLRVVDKLNAELGQDVYTMSTLSISGTHSHSGPGGYLQYVLYQSTSLGFVRETFDAWVTGITNAIVMAHRQLQKGKVFMAQGDLYGANINRSPTSYLMNTQEERDLYPEGDTDKNMLLLHLTADSSGDSLGVLNWFAVHGTSMNNTNTLTSGDNKGYASYMLERTINGPTVTTGQGSFVAAFASTNLGDTSPNTNGAKCIDTGAPCDGTTSTCNGKCENCIAFGPGTNGDMFESTQIIGDKQFQFALELMKDSSSSEVVGPIDYRHSFVKMSSLNVTLSDGKVKTLCSPAMGYSFAAGTTDGPGMFNFTQGAITSNPFWNKVRDFLSQPTPEEIACQEPKPILLNTGDINIPYEWDPETVPLQILRLGNVFILSIPAELTTMAGRRLRNTIRDIISEGGLVPSDQKVVVTIAGLANGYSSYVTTFEEYRAQRYEAASTIFGPHTLEGYIQEFSRLARDMVAGRISDTGPPPSDMTADMIQLMPEAHCDRTPAGVRFGEVIVGTDVKSQYSVGALVQASFQAANPRHNQRPTSSFLTVEQVLREDASNSISSHVIATDGDWSTQFHWQAGPADPFDLGLSRQSIATLQWTIPSDGSIRPGSSFQLCYHGDHRDCKVNLLIPFSGCSSVFKVV